LDNDLRIILGDYESLVQSHTIEINEKEVIYYITLKRTIISCPECGSRMNIKDYRKCKVIHNMIRVKMTADFSTVPWLNIYLSYTMILSFSLVMRVMQYHLLQVMQSLQIRL
jgi:hypothetical protein